MNTQNIPLEAALQSTVISELLSKPDIETPPARPIQGLFGLDRKNRFSFVAKSLPRPESKEDTVFLVQWNGTNTFLPLRRFQKEFKTVSSFSRNLKFSVNFKNDYIRPEQDYQGVVFGLDIDECPFVMIYSIVNLTEKKQADLPDRGKNMGILINKRQLVLK